MPSVRHLIPIMLAAVWSSGCGPFTAERPPLAPLSPVLENPHGGDRLIVRFLGTSSLLFQDQHNAILSDGFVSRPGSAQLARLISPDTSRIDRALNRLNLTALDAVFTGHSHYDHALDAPVFAQRTGAILLGSASTWNIGWGWGLPPEQLHVVHDGETLRFGKFELTFLESAHSAPEPFPGRVVVPLKPPARVGAWKSDTTWSVLIRYDQRTILVHGSANYKPGALAGRHADVVYLGIGRLGRQRCEFVDGYWQEVVRQTGARRVILVHWDDFTRSLDEPLRPLPFDAFHRAVDRIRRRAEADGVDVRLPVPWKLTDPFAGLTLSDAHTEATSDASPLERPRQPQRALVSTPRRRCDD